MFQIWWEVKPKFTLAPAPTPTPTPTPCDDGWTKAEGECYQYTDTSVAAFPRLNHNEAENACAESRPGVHLATISSGAQNQVVADLVGSKTEVHIGLMYDSSKSQAVWQSGKPLSNEPDYWHKTNADGECTRISGSAAHWNPSKWDDWPCTKTSRDGYVCSYTAGMTAAPSMTTRAATTGSTRIGGNSYRSSYWLTIQARPKQCGRAESP